MSPLLKSAEEAGIQGIIRKRNPISISPNDFFMEAPVVKEKFGKLVNCSAKQVALIPSASYGIQIAISNLPTSTGSEAIIIANEFPSSYYTLETWCKTNNKRLNIIAPTAQGVVKGKNWNERILEAITTDTVVVVMSHVHWTDGTLFDLAAIGQRCKATGTLLVVDGTQSVGALPIDVKNMQIDALICAAYKWLLGPYSSGLAYFSEYFNHGKPLEESWMNRANATDFKSLTQYNDSYMPDAGRFSMGESSNFIALPMLNCALTQLLAWEVAAIQSYCRQLSEPLITFLKTNGFGIEDEAYRSAHLIGFTPPRHLSTQLLSQELTNNQVYVSQRGDSIRVSFHLFNEASDVDFFVKTLKKLI